MPPDVLDLLTAIRDMASVPIPAIGAERVHAALVTRRLAEVHIALDVALSPKWVGTLDPAREAAHLRSRLADMPVTYTVWQQPAPATVTDGGEQA